MVAAKDTEGSGDGVPDAVQRMNSPITAKSVSGVVTVVPRQFVWLSEQRRAVDGPEPDVRSWRALLNGLD
jgi:hypothetical protein